MGFLEVRSNLSRIFFALLLGLQFGLLSQFVVNHENKGFYGIITLSLIPLVYWAVRLRKRDLKYKLGYVWLAYSIILVIMMGIIFGGAVIEDNKLREKEIATCLCKPHNGTIDSHSFFDSKFLKITLCLTPGLMLLLLTSVIDDSGELEKVYFTAVLDLFDGVEMIEVLHEDVCDKIPMGWEIAVLVAALLFFLLSFLEIHQVKFRQQTDGSNTQEPQPSFRKKTAIATTAFQMILNLAFLIIRLVLWFDYDFGAAVFLAKNMISFLILVVGVIETCCNWCAS